MVDFQRIKQLDGELSNENHGCQFQEKMEINITMTPYGFHSRSDFQEMYMHMVILFENIQYIATMKFCQIR